MTRSWARLSGSIGLLIALVIPALATLRVGFDDTAAICALALTPWATVLWVVIGERRSLRSIGFRAPQWNMIAFALAGIVVSLLITALVTKVCALVGLHETQSALMDRLLKGPGWFLVFLVTNGALLTEVSFRAYVIERIGELISGRVVLTAVIQIIVTTSIFIGGRGLVHGVVWFLDDVVFTVYYIKYRNTSVCIASHAVPNLIASGLIALRLAH